MMKRISLFLLLPLLLIACQKKATAQAPASNYKELMSQFHLWPSSSGFSEMIFKNHHSEEPLSDQLVKDVLRQSVGEGLVYLPGQRLAKKGYDAYFFCRTDSLREGMYDYLLCTFTHEGQYIDSYVCARERYEIIDGESVSVRIPLCFASDVDSISFHVKEYTHIHYNVDLEQGEYLCRETPIRVDVHGRISHGKYEEFSAYSYYDHGPDAKEFFIDDRFYASSTEFLEYLYGITGYRALQNSFWLSHHTSLQVREQIKADWNCMDVPPYREYYWEKLAGIEVGETTYTKASLLGINKDSGRKDQFIVSLGGRKERSKGRPDVITTLSIGVDYNNGKPIITSLAWKDDNRQERRQHVMDFLRELYSPLSGTENGKAWTFQNADFIRKHSSDKLWERLKTAGGDEGFAWWAFGIKEKNRVTVKKERMLLDIEPREAGAYDVSFLDCGDLGVTRITADMEGDKVVMSDIVKIAYHPTSYEVAFGQDENISDQHKEMLGRILEKGNDSLTLRYTKKVFRVAANKVSTKVRSAYYGQGLLYPEEKDTIFFYEQPSTSSRVVWRHLAADPTYNRYDCLGFEGGWFQTSIDGQKCYVRADQMHWMYYNNSKERIPAVEVERNAMFPGGDIECSAFLQQHIQMPKMLEEYGLNARVIVSFIVDTEGNLDDIKVVRANFTDGDASKIQGVTAQEQAEIKDLCIEILKAEALRVVRLMPRWEPAVHNGKAVESRFNIPILFKHQ